MTACPCEPVKRAAPISPLTAWRVAVLSTVVCSTPALSRASSSAAAHGGAIDQLCVGIDRDHVAARFELGVEQRGQQVASRPATTTA